ncbi:MAG: outer membrane lipoprotein-sorting protein [Nannocystaceae bacterium]
MNRSRYLPATLALLAFAGLFASSLAPLDVVAAPTRQAAKAPSPNSAEFPRYVLRRIDDMYRGEKSRSLMRMDVKTKHWTRSISLESWSLGEAYSLVRILSPKKERGTATLKADDDLFTYLNKTRRTIKITSGMMGGSWMGSHFSNDDLVRGSRLSEQYAIKTSFVGPREGTDVYVFVLTPKPDAPVVWGKIEVTIRQSDLVPLEQIFYDEDGEKMRALVFSDYKVIDGRAIAGMMEMKPLDKPGEYTRIHFDEIDFGVDLNKGFFTLQKLRSMR